MNTLVARHIVAMFAGLASTVVPFAAGGAEPAMPPPSPAAVAPGAAPNADPAPAPAWLAQVNAGAPGAFPPPRSFQASYRLTWSGIEAAHAEVTCDAAESSGQISTRIAGGTIGLARTLYQVDGTHVSVADRRTLRPLRLDQTELESKKRKVVHVDFTPGEALRNTQITDRTESASSSSSDNAPRKRAIHLPGMFDMHGAMLYVRSLPLAAGDTRMLIAMTAGNPYLVTVKVDGRGPVKTLAGTYPAIECSIGLSRINKHDELEPHKAFKGARVWISDDSDRVIVKAEAQVFVGTVTLDLAKVTFAGK